MADFDFDVVVCGYGLAGLSLASVLSRLGHRVCVLEKFPSLYGAPRLISVDGEGARILQAAGDIDRSLRVSAVPRHYSLLDADRELITRVDWRGLHMCGFAGRICFYQPDAAQEMAEAARARGRGQPGLGSHIGRPGCVGRYGCRAQAQRRLWRRRHPEPIDPCALSGRGGRGAQLHSRDFRLRTRGFRLPVRLPERRLRPPETAPAARPAFFDLRSGPQHHLYPDRPEADAVRIRHQS